MECKVLKHLPNDDMAMKLLERIRNEFLEIVQRRHWKVMSLNELCCCTDQMTKRKTKKKQYGDNVWGYNMTRGSSHIIYIRLRRPHSHTFHDYHDIAGTMSHELAHCVHSGHSAKFYHLMEEIQQQHAIYRTNNIVLDAQGFPMNSSKAYTLGGRRQYTQNNNNSSSNTDLIRQAAEQRALSASYKLETKQSLQHNKRNLKESCLRAAEARKVAATVTSQTEKFGNTITTCLPCYSTDILAIWNETENNNNHIEILLEEKDSHPSNNNNSKSHEAILRKRNHCSIIDLTSPIKNTNEERSKEKNVEKNQNDMNLWICQRCTFRNRHSRPECEVCGITYQSVVGNRKKVKKGHKKWDCSQCTYINNEANKSCQICGFSP